MLLYTCIGKMLSNIHAYNASNGGEKTQVVNQFLLLVTYHVILSIEISFSLFILLVLLHYILGWVGCFSDVVI